VALAWISLAALLVAIVLSCATRLNIGLVALVFAWIIGVYVADALGTPIGAKQVLAGFPGDLFVTLVGVAFLFAQAQANGTLDRVAHRAVRLCRGNAGLVPVIFFVLTLAIGSAGAGNIAAAALMGPLALAAAGRAGIPAFLMAIMVAHGATASSLSPISPPGVVANGILAKMGLGALQWKSYFGNAGVNAAIALAGYLAFGGWKLFRRGGAGLPVEDAPPFETRHRVTLGVIVALVAAVIAGRFLGSDVHVGLAALSGAVLLSVFGLADEAASLRAVPWGVLLMVSGVTVLTELLQKTGGMDLFSALLAKSSSPGLIPGTMALVAGLVSVYSSTMGVVLPTFLPAVPGRRWPRYGFESAIPISVMP
jgi:di/tricarboxylate transporter